MRKVTVDEANLLALIDEVQKLRARVSQLDGNSVGTAVQKSLERPVLPDSGRNAFVTAAVKQDLFKGRTKPVTKAKREQTDADRRTASRKERETRIGLRSSKYEKGSK